MHKYTINEGLYVHGLSSYILNVLETNDKFATNRAKAMTFCRHPQLALRV